MASFVKFNQFMFDLGCKVHDLRAGGDTLKIYLTAQAPNVATMAVKADLAEIVQEYGYVPGDITNDFTMVSGVATMTGVDVTFTGTGGDTVGFGPFRYVVLYNSSTTEKVDPLIGYWDIGEEVAVLGTNEYMINFGAVILTIT